jgi:hypothetical protein
MSYQKEEQLRKPVHGYFEKKQYQVFDEVPLFVRKIDVVAKRQNELVSIELKLHDWKRAISQACLNLRVSNFSYVALPEPVWDRIDTRIYSAAIEHGIGLLSVDGVTRQVMRPKRSQKIQPELRKGFLSSLRSCYS